MITLALLTWFIPIAVNVYVDRNGAKRNYLQVNSLRIIAFIVHAAVFFDLAGQTPIEWAKRRFIAAGVVYSPNSQVYRDWAAQMCMTLKGQNVWETDVEQTITAIIASGKFEEMANAIYQLRATKVEF